MQDRIHAASAAVEMLHKISARARKMSLHLSDYAAGLVEEATESPRLEAENRETLSVLHDELEGVMERLGCDLVFHEYDDDSTKWSS